MHEHEARLERLERERVEAPRAGSRLKLPGGALTGGPVRSGELVVRVEDLVGGYLSGGGRENGTDGTPPGEPRPVIRVPFLAAERGERIGIVGPNGAGKTTLLRTIAGELPPLDGMLVFGHQVQLAYLAQLRGAAIPGATVLEAITEAIPITAGEARGYLARFLFRGDDVFKEVRSLSGGERSRLELALLGILPSNLLLLDEPTNHLDIPAREAIEGFLAATQATLLVVSHDRRLLETVCQRLWVVEDGVAAPFDGGYRQWRAAMADGWTVHGALEQEARRLRPVHASRPTRFAPSAEPAGSPNGRFAPRSSRSSAAVTPVDPATGAPPAAAPARRSSSGKRERLSKDAYRKQKSVVEGELTRLGLRKSHLELRMGDPSVASNFVELRRITSELADIDASLAAAEDQWLEIEERAP